ncbi:FecR family protein [Pedobacter sp. MR2016-19]|uniref:FecR family protein n=1 Tax=Pedobacter sp. MR2016-19 TaxID=2780089 RepID=UPI001876D1F1|nr:FecR family protein [Pedobacter sp. MR2016-19]MBE5318701.1 FecR family protein [Pedobacter sp. MR2016-19]
MKNFNHITKLYQKYLDNACNPQELQELLHHFEDDEPNAELVQMIRTELEIDDERYVALPQVQAILSKLDESMQVNVINPIAKRRSLFTTSMRYWSAAALLFLSLLLYYGNERLNFFGTYTSTYKNDIPAGGDKAYLILADGKRIALTDSMVGTITPAPGFRISKTAKGQLRYELAKGASGNGYNTITTPKGGKYEVILADGTHVYLNAASSLRFPASFTGVAERRVTLTGEGYFEVSHRNGQPFYVQSGKQLLRVLGTHFNLKAYPDEQSVKTTLLQGSVEVSSSEGSNAVLKPGQQSQLDQGKLKLAEVDVMAATDWQRAEINLKAEDFQSTMRKIARWYDVEIVFDETAPSDLTLGGLVSRDKSLVAVLKVMELTGKVHFKVEGRRVTVMR